MKKTTNLVLLFWLLAAIGWIANVIRFCSCDFAPSYKEEIIRGIGIVIPPVGAIIGYIPI